MPVFRYNVCAIMSTAFITIRVGTRNSRLALLQCRHAVAQLERLLPAVQFEVMPMKTIGDRDLQTDLRISPPDFFTRELDVAVVEGRLDCAVHSAKDLPSPLPAGLEACRLPWREDARDAWILPQGKKWSDVPAAPVIGISSARREDFARKRFPAAVMAPVRGTIEERLAQLDAGKFDLLLMAGAALVRLGLQARISEWIALEALPTPEGQGFLALTYRANDSVMLRVRGLFVKNAKDGPLQGMRVLLTCSEALLKKAEAFVRDFGGTPVACPLIRLVPNAEARHELQNMDRYGWILITSPSAVRCLAELSGNTRSLPKFIVCGPGTAEELKKSQGIVPTLQPAWDFGGAGVLAEAESLRKSGKPILRVRSDKAGAGLAEELRRQGLDVTDLVIYKNERIHYAEFPKFDAVFFASASAVEAYVELWGGDTLVGRLIAAIGKPTMAALRQAKLPADVVGVEATVAYTMLALAAHQVNAILKTMEQKV